MQCKQNEIPDLKKRGKVEMVDAYKGRRGARDEDTDLVNGIVGAVKGPVLIEGGRLEREQ